MANIAQAIKMAAQRGEQMYLKLCTVDLVDALSGTVDCSPVDGGAQLLGVRLGAAMGAAGILVLPAVGSEIIVGFLDRNNAVALVYSEVETLEVATGTEDAYSAVVMDKESIVFNEGENGGMCITPELKTQLDKMSARIDGIIDAINNAAFVAQDGGAMLQTNIKTALAGLTDVESFENIENDKIKH
jgi:hypothetical protein